MPDYLRRIGVYEISKLQFAADNLAKELEQRNQLMPRIVHFQFDNCGENKNKEMFCFASTLLELFFFEEIHMNFLIVGHTHCNLDQNFSVCSPLGIVEILKTAHTDLLQRPWHVINVECVHDYINHFFNRL